MSFFAVSFIVLLSLTFSLACSTPSTLISSSSCKQPSSLTRDESRKLTFAACAAQGVLVVEDGQPTTTPPQVILESAICADPTQVSAYGSFLFVACYDSYIYVVSLSYSASSNSNLPTPASVVALTNSSVCLFPSSVAFNSLTGVLYGACLDGAIFAVNTDTATANSIKILVSNKAPACDSPSSLSVAATAQSSTTATLSVACAGSTPGTGTVLQLTVDETLFTVTAKKQVLDSTQCQKPQKVLTDSAGELVVSCGSSGVKLVSVTGGVSLLVASSSCPSSSGLALDSLTSTTTLYTSCIGAGVLATPTTSGTVTSSVEVDPSFCSSPSSVLYSPPLNLLFFSCNNVGVLTSVTCVGPIAPTITPSPSSSPLSSSSSPTSPLSSSFAPSSAPPSSSPTNSTGSDSSSSGLSRSNMIIIGVVVAVVAVLLIVAGIVCACRRCARSTKPLDADEPLLN